MLKKILPKLRNIDIIIAGTVLSALVVYTFVAVFMRYIINRPVYWGEEFQLLCIVIIVFFGAGAGFRTGSHIAIDFLVELFPPKVRKAITVIIYLAVLVVMIYFFMQSSALVRQMFVTRRVTDILRIPFYVTYTAFPVGCALIIINYTAVTYSKYFKSGNEEVTR